MSKEEKTQRNSKIIVACIYALTVSVAFNFFWLPGSIYASGITGFSQLIVSVFESFFGFSFSIPLIVLMMNIPLLLISWFMIDRQFTQYTILAVLLTYVFMSLVPVKTIVTDPILASIVGGILHGASVGITLNSDFSTGGLDIIGILVRKRTGRSIGSIFIIFNCCIQFAAGFLYGWQYAFYSALAVFVSGKTVDFVNTKQQKVQIMLVTEHSEELIPLLQNTLKRGITIVNNVEGGFLKEEKKILFIVASQKEVNCLNRLVKEVDQQAFMSISPGVVTNTNFYEW
ncbi:YitT family protein [Enterococcus sp. LJL98]